ncbi:phenylacetate--CoA ligase family protein [Legionella maioricensis]|uniref:Phenylacetate--CoA ligase family protein n=1 Tax=Legionella maioricensis TaxID=2896528 RepID=A0A9X2IB43_9GAMM|nr:phenylacetate--CoA ligase family protein [Legionella maioricensis]MCL9683931.1 phenylacetate--CoA ligase family protein [Legionella maioricensis]MCL9688303.1 phenylacetate--CoA ligase family protein [Legionella maioricensis]
MSFFRFLNRLNQVFNRVYERNFSSTTPADLVWRHMEDCQKQFQKNQEAIYYSKKMLEELSNQRLRALLFHAKSKSPWYKKTLAKINIDNFTKERLSELPTINKTILMENWDAIVTNPKLSLALVEKHLNKKSDKIDTLYLFSRYHVVSTGGSSGKRGIFVYDWDEWITFHTAFIRYPFYNYERTHIVTKTLNKDRKIVSLFVTNTAVAAYSLAKTFWRHDENLHFLPMAVTPLNIVITRLNQIRPDILTASPSYLHKVCQLVQKGQIKIEPKIIFIGGEPLFGQTEDLIKETWPKVNLFNIFGCTEGVTGLSCRANTDEMHLNEDLCIVEPLDEQSRPVDKGTMATKIYLTNLYNYTLPLIRYENSDDILFLNKTCDCGIQHQLIKAPRGRPGCDFNYPGNIFVHHSLFLTPLLLEKNIQEYLVEQTINGVNIKILATGFIDKRKLQENIRLRLSKAGLLDAKVNIIEVPEIVYLYSGKLNRFIPLNPNSVE